MKYFKIISILLLLSAGVNAQTKVAAPLVRNSPIDATYGTHFDSLGYGGLVAFSSIANRNAFPTALRKRGMAATIKDSIGIIWQLQGGVTNSDWYRFSLGSGSGSGTTDTTKVKLPCYVKLKGTGSPASLYDSLICPIDSLIAVAGALKLNISDTSTMIAPYLRSAIAAATYATISNLALKVNISDTAAMLQKYKDTLIAHNSRIIAKQNLLTLTTTGSSGASTLIGGTLNIPQYSGGGGGSTLPDSTWIDVKNYFTGGVTLATSTKQQRCDAWQAAIAAAQSGKYGIQFSGSWDLPTDSLIVTEKIMISGVGTQSALTTTDSSGALLYINQNTPRAWYNVIFVGRKSSLIQNMTVQYRGSSNPDTTSTGIKISVDTSVTFDHKVENVTIDSFYTGLRLHNVGSSQFTRNYFRNNRAYGVRISTSESTDLGKLIFNKNTWNTVGPLGGEPDTTAHIRILGGAGIYLVDNDMYGYTAYGVWQDMKTFIEYFQATTGSEYVYQNNRIAFVKDYAFLIDSYYGKSGSGPGINTGNRILGVQIKDNYTTANGLLKTVGGTGSLFNFQVSGNESIYPKNSIVPGSVFKIPVVINGSALRTLQFTNNMFDATIFGTLVDGAATKAVSVTGTILGTVVSSGNLYTGYPTASDIAETQNPATTIVLSPLITGGTGTTSTLTYKTTTGVGTTGADHIWVGGNNGATELMRLTNGGKLAVGTPTASDVITARGSGLGNAVVSIRNTATTGDAQFLMLNDAGIGGSFFKLGTAYSTYKSLAPSNFGIYNGSTGNISMLNDNASGNINFSAGGSTTPQVTIASSGITTFTGSILTRAGTSSANTAPLKVTSGTVNATPEAGAVEFDGTNYYVTTTGAGRILLTRTLVGTAAPAATPSAVGIQWVDTVNKKLYVATGTASSADWTILN